MNGAHEREDEAAEDSANAQSDKDPADTRETPAGEGLRGAEEGGDEDEAHERDDLFELDDPGHAVADPRLSADGRGESEHRARGHGTGGRQQERVAQEGSVADPADHAKEEAGHTDDREERQNRRQDQRRADALGEVLEAAQVETEADGEADPAQANRHKWPNLLKNRV